MTRLVPNPCDWLSCVLVMLLLAVSIPSVAADGVIDVSLRPIPFAGVDGRITEIQVLVRMPVDTQAAGAPLMRIPLVVSNVKTSADSLRDLKVHDSQGELAVNRRDDPATSESYYRHWVASRAVKGPVIAIYRIPITNAPNPLGAAPPFELRSDGAVFSGLLGTFLLLPDSTHPYRLSLQWDLKGLGAGTIGVSTLGVDDQVSALPQPPSKLESIFAMGGRISREPEQPAADGFFSVWQGYPPFDARALMQWTHRMYQYDLTFFKAPKTTYSVFLRSNPINPGGGVEVQHSFVGTFGPDTSPEDFKLTLAHEMVHTFVGALDDKDELAASWFSEGLAVYYQRLLPWRAGLISGKAYLQDINLTAARYYTDKLNTTPNTDIAKRFWADTRVRVLPYDRGALYFTQLNAEIQAASHGRRSLDDLLLAFLSRRNRDLDVTNSDWVAAVVKEIGPRGKQQFEDMMRGKLIVLASDTFGPCFRRVSVSMRRYDLGFTPDVLIESKRIVRGLIPGSNAAEAGLRNGDQIIEPVPQDAIQADQNALLHLTIRRSGQVMHIQYLPRGASVPTWQWVQTR